MTTFVQNATESRSVAEFTEQAYLNYAMYVIMDRELPNISDGLNQCSAALCTPWASWA